MPHSRFIPAAIVLIGAIGLAGCNAKVPAEGGSDGGEDTSAVQGVEASASPNPDAEPSEAVSILRPDIEQPEPPKRRLEALNAAIGFPNGGAELDEAAGAQLQDIAASEQIALGGPIVLRGHSDAGGSDAANERASQARALSVAEWLIAQGIDSDRIDVIVFGEQNPVQPNALPDGSPNEEGRAANRRVEISIVPPAQDAGSAEPGD